MEAKGVEEAKAKGVGAGAIFDVIFPGGSHIDPVGPMPWLGRKMLGWDQTRHDAMLSLATAFVVGTLESLHGGGDGDGFTVTLHRLVDEGRATLVSSSGGVV